jgi:hypothetical protein
MEEINEENEEMILKIIGSGGFSNIYSFNINKTIYDDDVKTYSLNLPSQVKKFNDNDTRCLKISDLDIGYKEYKYLAKLKHENIINIYFGKDDLYNNKFLTILEKHDLNLKNLVEE